MSKFIVVNDRGEVFQDPMNAGYSWLHPRSKPHNKPKIFDTMPSAEELVAAYNGVATVQPYEEATAVN